MIYFCYLFFQAIVTTSFSPLPLVAGLLQVSNINLDPCPQFSIMCLPLKKEHQHKWVCLKISLCKPILSFCRWAVQKIISAARNKSPNRTTSPPVSMQLFVLLLPLPMLPPKVSPRSIWIGGGWVIADIIVWIGTNHVSDKEKKPSKWNNQFCVLFPTSVKAMRRLLVGRTDKACALQEANDHIITVMWPCRKGRLKVPHMMSFRKPLR